MKNQTTRKTTENIYLKSKLLERNTILSLVGLKPFSKEWEWEQCCYHHVE